MDTIAWFLNPLKGQKVLMCSLVITIIVYLYYIKTFSYWKKRNIQYVTPVPFFGNLLDVFFLRRNMAEQLAEIYRSTKGPIVGIFMLNRPALLIRDPDLIKKIVIKNFDYFQNRTISTSINHTLIPNGTCGMLASQDETWKWLRKTVTPAFSASQLKMTTGDVRNLADKAADYIRRSADPTDGDTNLGDVCKRFTIESGCSTFFGIEANCFSAQVSQYMALNSNLFDYNVFTRGVQIAMTLISPTITKWLGLSFFHEASTKLFVGNVAKTLSTREGNSEQRNDYLDLLKDAMKEYNGDGNLLSNSVEIFVANNETLSSILIYCCFELVKNQEIQRKLREELFQLQNNDNAITCEQTCQLKYLECFVKEVIRMYPNVAFLDRICKQDFLLDDPQLTIEKGTSVYVPLLGLHFDPKHYHDPHIFNPDRFLNEAIDWSVYLPFGKGPRMCPAKKYSEIVMKTFLTCLLTNFHLSESSRTPEKMLFNTKGFTLQPIGELFGKVQPLSKRSMD